MDPPYYDNVMYAELSDFFYVLLKRTAGHVFPQLFTRQLTDKDNEAVAIRPGFRARRVPERWRGGTTRIEWPPSSPSAGGCLTPTAS